MCYNCLPHSLLHAYTHTCSHLYYVDELDIKRISADGSGNPQTVYLEYMQLENRPKDLAVDVINNLLYWTVGDHILYLNMTHWETLTETQREFIEPETVRPGFAGVVPHGISVVNNTIYWTEDRQVNQENHEITRPGAIYSLSLPTNTSQRLLQNDTLSPQDLSTFINISGMFECCVLDCMCPGTSLAPRPPNNLGMGLIYMSQSQTKNQPSTDRFQYHAHFPVRYTGSDIHTG